MSDWHRMDHRGPCSFLHMNYCMLKKNKGILLEVRQLKFANNFGITVLYVKMHMSRTFFLNDNVQFIWVFLQTYWNIISHKHTCLLLLSLTRKQKHKYQYYNCVHSNQHNNCMYRQYVCMSCNWRNKYENSFCRNVRVCRLKYNVN